MRSVIRALPITRQCVKHFDKNADGLYVLYTEIKRPKFYEKV